MGHICHGNDGINASIVWSTTRNEVTMMYSINGLVQDCSISIADAMEILQSCTKPLLCDLHIMDSPYFNKIQAVKIWVMIIGILSFW